jgi:hypothetical protein
MCLLCHPECNSGASVKNANITMVNIVESKCKMANQQAETAGLPTNSTALPTLCVDPDAVSVKPEDSMSLSSSFKAEYSLWVIGLGAVTGMILALLP